MVADLCALMAKCLSYDKNDRPYLINVIGDLDELLLLERNASASDPAMMPQADAMHIASIAQLEVANADAAPQPLASLADDEVTAAHASHGVPPNRAVMDATLAVDTDQVHLHAQSPAHEGIAVPEHPEVEVESLFEHEQ
jgi:hypothetical protein